MGGQGRSAALAALAAIWVLTASAVAQARQIVPFAAPVAPGTIVIDNSERRLYFALGEGRAIVYRVAVGRAGAQWTGRARIQSKRVRPDWSPPAVVKRDMPHLPDVIPGGAPNNPMGYGALLLDRHEVAIHGTSRSMRASIGTAASYGCIRMLDEDIADLFGRVSVGTPVVVVP
jgi:lipoprotein-anchoring transpeptidase ErfK/SrfK